jgi:hypothetical protein
MSKLNRPLHSKPGRSTRPTKVQLDLIVHSNKHVQLNPSLASIVSPGFPPVHTRSFTISSSGQHCLTHIAAHCHQTIQWPWSILARWSLTLNFWLCLKSALIQSRLIPYLFDPLLIKLAQSSSYMRIRMLSIPIWINTSLSLLNSATKDHTNTMSKCPQH